MTPPPVPVDPTDEPIVIPDDLEAALAALAPACNWQHHDRGWTGCDPEAPASYVIEVRAHCTKMKPKILLICEGQQIRLRSSAHETVECGLCGITATIHDIISLLGPIADYRP